VAKLYRRAPVDSPSFEHGTFWVHPGQRDNLDQLAEIEAGTRVLSPHRNYVADVPPPDGTPGADPEILRHEVDHLLGLVERVPTDKALPQLRDGISRETEEVAGLNPGLQWLELTAGGASWALVYMGNEELPAVPCD
jgi:hypothetical protein